MRTTLTIEDDLAIQLQRYQKERGLSLKLVVNKALREGIKQLTSPTPKHKPVRMRSVSLGKCLTSNVDDVGEALAIADGEDFK